MKRLIPKERSAAVDKDLIRDLADLLQETGLAEIEVEHEGFRIRVARPSAVAPAAALMPAPALASAPSEPALERPPAPERAVHPGTVKSPMVGTAYRAPAPGAQPFVEVGSEIKEGDPICIIEAMKIMNEIEAEIAGVIREVCVEDAQPVEFGQVLFRVDPNG